MEDEAQYQRDFAPVLRKAFEQFGRVPGEDLGLAAKAVLREKHWEEGYQAWVAKNQYQDTWHLKAGYVEFQEAKNPGTTKHMFDVANELGQRRRQQAHQED